MIHQTDESEDALNKDKFLKSQADAKLKKIISRKTQNVQVFDRTKTVDDWKFIQACLKNHFVFYNLSNKQLENIRAHMFMCQVDEGQFVYESGDKATCFFIVKDGILELLVDEKFKSDLKPHDGFGEIALLYNTQRTSSVRARQHSTLWMIDRITFRQAVEESIIEEYTENRKCLEGARFFWGLSKEQKDTITASLIIKKFKKNQTIIKEGDPGSSYYYIKEGTASVFKGSKFIRKLFKGDSFGEQSLYYNTMRQLTIKADDEVVALILARDTLNRIMGDQIYEVTFKNFIRWAFDNNSRLQKLTKDHTQKLIDNMKISNYKANETIFRKGIVGFQKIVVVIEGQLKSLKHGSIVASKGQCFGQEFFLQDHRKKALDDEIIMQSYGVLAQLPDLALIESLGLHLMDSQQELKINKVRMIEKNLYTDKINKTSLQSLKVINHIAEGQFGELYLARDNYMNHFCLKKISKKLIDQYQVLKFIKSQANIHRQVSHAYICAAGNFFHTKSAAYYLCEYIEGQDLYSVMKFIGLLSSDDSKFYAANIIIMLEYLHQKSIIVRDIKPQNFMVDRFGFLKLINLSVAKHSQKQKKDLLKTYTIIGTPHYMAPDIILGKGYNNMVDLWSLGVTIYEFLCGFLPFGDQAEGAYEIYEEIMQNQVKFPDFMNDKKAKKFIEQLLNHNPESRLNGSFLNLKGDLWLQGINWQSLETRMYSSDVHIPFQPKFKEKEKYKEKFNIPLIEFVKEQNAKDKGYVPTQEHQWQKFGEFIN